MGEEEEKKRHEFLQTENELLLFLCVIFWPDIYSVSDGKNGSFMAGLGRLRRIPSDVNLKRYLLKI
jgi:hypothetical protein